MEEEERGGRKCNFKDTVLCVAGQHFSLVYCLWDHLTASWARSLGALQALPDCNLQRYGALPQGQAASPGVESPRFPEPFQWDTLVSFCRGIQGMLPPLCGGHGEQNASPAGAEELGAPWDPPTESFHGLRIYLRCLLPIFFSSAPVLTPFTSPHNSQFLTQESWKTPQACAVLDGA